MDAGFSEGLEKLKKAVEESPFVPGECFLNEDCGCRAAGYSEGVESGYFEGFMAGVESSGVTVTPGEKVDRLLMQISRDEASGGVLCEVLRGVLARFLECYVQPGADEGASLFGSVSRGEG